MAVRHLDSPDLVIVPRGTAWATGLLEGALRVWLRKRNGIVVGCYVSARVGAEAARRLVELLGGEAGNAVWTAPRDARELLRCVMRLAPRMSERHQPAIQGAIAWLVTTRGRGKRVGREVQRYRARKARGGAR